MNPHPEERPAAFAERIGLGYAKSTQAEHKKRLGQFLTPIGVADFMASLLKPADKAEIRILDPGAGSGVLACAVSESLAATKTIGKLVIDAYEIDNNALPTLEQTLQYLKHWLERRGIESRCNVFGDDFILKQGIHLQTRGSLFADQGEHEKYDVVVANPPYFKLPKSDPRAIAARAIVHGQPNIYALFMGVSAALLNHDAELVFITPRSFASGPYFQRFREQFFGAIQLEAVHVFDSRREAFNRDGVLQENIILKGRKSSGWLRRSNHCEVELSVSQGASDIDLREVRKLAITAVLDMQSKEKILRIPSSAHDLSTVQYIDKWTGSLSSYGMQASTGPVVPFRATPLLSDEQSTSSDNSPLLWLQHVRPMSVTWPLPRFKKQQFINNSLPSSRPLLLTNRNYVLLRRFSAKEERRRLIAAPLIKGQLAAEWIGIENHVNYIHRPGGSLTQDEALGLAVIYNCQFMDVYFRVMNGSTQVSAMELRKIPLPPLEVIVEIGRRARVEELTQESIEALGRLAFSATPRTLQANLSHA